MDNTALPGKPGPADAQPEPYSLGRAIGLHLLPGVIATAVYVGTAPC